MKRKRHYSLLIPALVLVALVASALSILSYIKTVSDNISKADTMVDSNCKSYHDFSLAYLDNSLNNAISTLSYISNKADSDSTSDLESTANNYIDAIDSKLNTAVIPDSITTYSLSEIDRFVLKADKKSDRYYAFSSLLKNDYPKSAVFFDTTGSEPGFYILYPILGDSGSLYEGKLNSAILAFYSKDTFVQTFINNKVTSNCIYSICTTNNKYVFSLNAKDSTLYTTDKEDYISGFFPSDAQISSKKISNDISSGNSNEFTLYNKDDDAEYHIYYNPISTSSCNVINLYFFASIPNDSGIASNAHEVITKKSNYIISSLIVIFTILSIIIFLLQNYYSKKQEQSNDKLIIEKERYKTVVENSRWTIWEYDFATTLLTKLTDENYEPVLLAQLKSRAIRTKAIHMDDVSIFSDFLDQLSAGSKDIKGEFRMLSENGSYEWYESAATAIYDSNNNPVTAIIRTYNIDSQKKEIESVKNLAERDNLTRLYNLSAVRNHMTSILNDMTSSFMHALMIIDIDNFTLVNENFGQMFGDAILLDFASKLSNHIGANDIAGRINSDKFIVFLYNIPYISYADEMGQSILDIFTDFDLGATVSYSLTCSIGISLYPNHGDSFESLVAAADIALYNSKKHGKNKFTVYSENLASIRTGHDFTTMISNSSDSSSSHTVIDNDIIYSVVEMLFESKELSASLSMAFSLIGNYYSFDRIGMIEYSDDELTATNRYAWSSQNFERFSNNNLTVDIGTDSTFSFFKTSDSGVYYTNSLDNLELAPSSITDVIKCASATSVFQCAVTDNGILKGYLYALSIDRTEWASHTVDSLTLLAKIIGGYIIKQRSQENAYKLTQTDMLTGCDNLFAFVKRATEISQAAPLQQFATVYMDIDNFKLVNDKYGFSAGDHVLIDFARIIEDNLRENEAVGHVDADKFVVFAKFMGMSDFDARIISLFKTVAAHVKDLIGDRINLIAGVYISKNESDISAAVDRANIARKSIKDHHHSTYEMFNESMKSSLVIKNDIENAMDNAIENEEFKVFYQPKINIITNQICGSEALVRWDRPGKGLISPGVFIPVFEDDGFIVEIDFYVFNKVCALLRELLDKGMKVYPVSVNFSRVHLKNDNILTRLVSTITKYNIDPSLIEVEITESALSEGDDFTPSILNSIRNLGFKLSMDDFGCGLSSLNSLRKFPFDILKLDKDFFNSDGISEKEQLVIANIVNLAKQLNMEIIAEGIETQEQADFLRSIDCPIVQGFLYSPPIPEERFIKEYL